jgi:hypothetical protein
LVATNDCFEFLCTINNNLEEGVHQRLVTISFQDLQVSFIHRDGDFLPIRRAVWKIWPVDDTRDFVLYPNKQDEDDIMTNREKRENLLNRSSRERLDPSTYLVSALMTLKVWMGATSAGEAAVRDENLRNVLTPLIIA